MSPRRAGLLLHPTSLPGRLGIGDLGPGADAFLAWAATGGQSVWQVLPLGPTGHNNSPYNALSAFAGNPLLISPERLRDDGLLPASALSAPPRFPRGRVEFGWVLPWRQATLRGSWSGFKRRGPRETRRELEGFLADPAQASWLPDWTLYSALKDRYSGRPWTEWDAELRRREPQALERARRELAPEIDYHAYLQFLFFRQWQRIKDETLKRGIRILGDLPIYVALDSADTWAHASLFDLDGDGRPREVAGVPPDYFSATGQLWGNPLYRWDRIAEEGFAWWIERVRANFRLADLLRLDHFRGFAAYWAIPAAEPTAAKGVWRPGPGARLFEAIRAALGELPFVAEDLGHITPEVRELRRTLGLPGMKVLQFAFAAPDSDHHPRLHDADSVVYTGTHDNDTTRGWFQELEEDERERVLEAVGRREGTIEWDLIRAAYESPAELAVVPLQDVLGLGTAARMNTPARPSGNWEWRLARRELRRDLAARLRSLALATGRLHSPREG